MKKGKKIHKAVHQKAGNRSQYTWGKVNPAHDDNFNKSRKKLDRKKIGKLKENETKINGKKKEKKLFQPQPQNLKKEAGWFQWMLVAIIILIILNIFIWSDYFNFRAYFVKEEEKKRNFNPFNGEFESLSLSLYGILFGAFVGYLVYRLLKGLLSWSIPQYKDYKVSKVEHKAWKRKSADNRLSSRWSLDGLRISQYFFDD